MKATGWDNRRRMETRADRCYVVTGPFRSGTSLVARLIATLGADPGPTGELFEPSEWNPAGYLQRPDITAFNKRLIAKAGGHDGEPPAAERIEASASAVDFTSLESGWMRQPGDVVVKDPRFSFTLKAWLRHGAFLGKDVRLVITSRETDDMVRSALSHYDVRHYCGNSVEGARTTLAAYAEAAERTAEATGLPCLRLSYALLDREPKEAVRTLAEFMEISTPGRIAAACRACDSGRSRALGPEEL